MTPMPPTSSAMPPIDASSSRNWFCVAATVSSSSALLTIRKSSTPCSDVMKLRNSSCVSLIWSMSSTATHDLPRELLAEQPQRAGLQRHEHRIVLVLPAGAALARQHADDLERRGADQHPFAERILPFGEQRVVDRSAEHGDGFVVVAVLAREEDAARDLPVPRSRQHLGRRRDPRRVVRVAPAHRLVVLQLGQACRARSARCSKIASASENASVDGRLRRWFSARAGCSVSMFVPIALMRWMTPDCTPWPIASIATTDATPITMPSSVEDRAEQVRVQRAHGHADRLAEPAEQRRSAPAHEELGELGVALRVDRVGLAAAVANDAAVAELDDAVGVARDFRVVRDQDHRVALARERSRATP